MSSDSQKPVSIVSVSDLIEHYQGCVNNSQLVTDTPPHGTARVIQVEKAENGEEDGVLDNLGSTRDTTSNVCEIETKQTVNMGLANPTEHDSVEVVDKNSGCDLIDFATILEKEQKCKSDITGDVGGDGSDSTTVLENEQECKNDDTSDANDSGSSCMVNGQFDLGTFLRELESIGYKFDDVNEIGKNKAKIEQTDGDAIADQDNVVNVVENGNEEDQKIHDPSHEDTEN